MEESSASCKKKREQAKKERVDRDAAIDAGKKAQERRGEGGSAGKKK